MTSDITVVIPSIPPRLLMLARALDSVMAQTLPATKVVVETDEAREGAAVVRDRGLRRVETAWTAFLDDDDVLMPQHLERLAACATETGADYVYSWYEVVGGDDPLPFFGVPWDNDHPHQTTITTLVRTELAQAVGFHQPIEGATVDGQRHGEDYEFTLGCMAAGARIVHLPERTWFWNHHGGNTSGRPDQW